MDPHFQLRRQGVIYTDSAEVSAVEAVCEKMRDKVWRIVVRFDRQRERLAAIFETALVVGNCVVLIDEIPYFAPTGTPAVLFPGLEKMIRQGRSREVRLIGTAHRPQDVNTLLVGESDFYLCRMFEPNAIQKLKGFYPGAEGLSELPDPYVLGGALHLTFVRPFADNERVTAAVPLGIL